MGALKLRCRMRSLLRRRGFFTQSRFKADRKRARLAVDPEDWRRQRFFEKLFGVTIGVAIVAVALTILQHWPMR